jgi:hypothetical protein
MKVAKAKGRLRGKQPKLNRRQEAHLVALLKGGEYSTAELADLFGVARSTVTGRWNGSEFARSWVSAAPLVDSVCCPAWHTMRDSHAIFVLESHLAPLVVPQSGRWVNSEDATGS